MNPILSVIIPTKNRYSYLTEVLNILTGIKRNDVEYIITDNSTDNTVFNQFVQSLNDERIRYYYVKHNMSQTENSDYALSLANGEYICFIGDDDIILENIFVMIERMKLESIDCMIQDPITYYWGDVNFKYELSSQKPASFIFGSDYKYSFLTVDVEKELANILNAGATRIGLLPKVYHGIVRKELLDEIKAKCGSYFPGPSPDMASSVALSLFAAKTILSAMPFTISGKSGKSASGMGLTHTHIGDLNKDFLPKNVIETWNDKIPKFWSCSTIWAQSALYSLNACDSKLDINYKALYTNLLVFESGFTKQINEKIDLNCSFPDKVEIYSRRMYIFLLRVRSFIQRRYFSYDGMKTYSDVHTIKECYDMVNSLLVIDDSATGKDI